MSDENAPGSPSDPIDFGSDLNYQQLINQFQQSMGTGGDNQPSAEWFGEFLNNMSSTNQDYPDILQPTKEEYKFETENPYFGDENLEEKAKELCGSMMLSKAILACEAELTKDEANSSVWNLLGSMHQEGDQDEKAIYCFKKAIEHDSKNIEAMLNLAVSYVNDLMITEFLAILKKFLQTDSKYKDFALNVFTPDKDPTIENLNTIISEGISKLDKEVNLYIARGLLCFAEHNFEKAADCFKSAVIINPKSYSLWNKLGASYANSNNNDKALVCYDMAINIRPNLTRSWVNLGIAHYNKDSSSSNCVLPFLNALSLNPNATHVWSYLINVSYFTADESLKAKILSKNLNEFRGVYNLIDPNNLPAPNYSKMDDSIANL